MYCCNCAKQMEAEANFCSACGAARPQANPVGGDAEKRLGLSRVRAGRKIAGVCGGIARYFDFDVTLVRILWIVLTLVPPLPGAGLVAYVVCWVAMPQEPPPYSTTTNAEGAPTFSA